MARPRIKILVVDDEPALIRAYSRLVSPSLKDPADFLTAINVVSAIQVFDAHEDGIGAVISDMMMPDATGIDFYRHVRKGHPHLPFAFCSGGMPSRVQSQLDGILQEDPQAVLFDKPPPLAALRAWVQGALSV